MRFKSFLYFVGLSLTLLAGAGEVTYAYPQLMAYRSFLPEEEETARFAKLGIPLRTIFIANTIAGNGRPYCQYPLVWKGFGDYDFAPVDAQFNDILKASPNERFVVMLDLNTPIWLTRRLGYDSFNEITHVLSLPKYRAQAGDYLEKLIRYIEAHYGDKVESYLLMCGCTSEWFERKLRQSAPKNAAWRDWCAARCLDYGASAPTESELTSAAFEGTIYDPATEQRKIDFWKFHSQIISDGVLYFSHIAKEACGRKKSIGADCGYYFICDKGAGGSGCLDYERVLASPDFDCILSPATYSGREIGGGTGSMLVAGTCRRYGKRFFYSIDQWPHNLKCPYRANYFHTLEETIAGNTRNAAFALIHHASFHWFDQWGDFYKDPALSARIAKLAEIQKVFAADTSAPLADVLIVADPDSASGRIDPRMTPDVCGAKCPEGFVPAMGCGEEFRNRINHIGVGYDVVSFNDLPHIDLSRFKAVVLSDVWTITPEKAKMLKDYVLKDNRTILWTYAPGVSDGKTLDARRVQDWAGVPFKTPGVTTTARDGWTSVYAYEHHLMTPEKLREIFAAAGCHLWTDDLVPVMANERLLSVHVKEGGVKTIHLPRPCSKVIDLLTDRLVATNCTDFTDSFASPDTKLYETVYEVPMPVVTFDGAPVPVQEMTVSAIPFNRYYPGYQRPKSQTKTAYFAAFDTEHGGTLKVNGETWQIAGVGKYTFTLGDGATELHVFADSPWHYEKTENELYFGPGEHFPELIVPEDNQTIVLDRGAVVHGTLFINRKHNVKIVGRGILDLSTLKRADPQSKVYQYVQSLGLPPNELSEKESDPGMSCTAIVAYGAENLLIDGITIRDSPRWTVMLRNGCRGVTIDNVKILGSWRYNNDGIDICSASEVNIRNCFIRVYDDALVVRAPFLTGERVGARDILVEDCTLWNDWGCSSIVCQQRHPSVIEGVTFRRLKLERVETTAASVHVTMGSTNAVIRDVVMEDYEVHNEPGRLAWELQTSDDQPFIPRRPEDLYLAIVQTRELGRWTANQKIVRDVPDDWFHINFENIAFRNFKVIGDWSKPVVQFSTGIPTHTVTNLVYEGFSADVKLLEKGGVKALPVPALDHNLADIPGLGKVGFRLELGKPCFPTPVRTICARDMKTFTRATDEQGVHTLTWKGHPLCGDDFTVIGTLTPKPEGGYASSLHTENNASSYDIQHTSFPVQL